MTDPEQKIIELLTDIRALLIAVVDSIDDGDDGDDEERGTRYLDGSKD